MKPLKKNHKGLTKSYYLTPKTLRQIKALMKIYDIAASRVIEKIINDHYEKVISNDKII